MMVMMMRAIVRVTMLIMLIRMRVFFLIRYADSEENDSEILTEHKAIFGHEDSVALYICLFFPVLNYDCW